MSSSQEGSLSIWVGSRVFGGLYSDVAKGPLLYHFENNEDGEPSIELTLEELRTLLPKCGFTLDVRVVLPVLNTLNSPQEEKMIDTTYTNNSKSMLQYTYKACFWYVQHIDK